MTTRELIVVILNHTNEELNLEPQSPSLERGHWLDSLDIRPPSMMLGGESGVLRCQSNHVGGGVEGSITYHIVGFEQKKKVVYGGAR